MTSMEPVTKFRTTISSIKVKAKNIHLGLMHDREDAKSVILILWQPPEGCRKDTCSHMVYGVKHQMKKQGTNRKSKTYRETDWAKQTRLTPGSTTPRGCMLFASFIRMLDLCPGQLGQAS